MAASPALVFGLDDAARVLREHYRLEGDVSHLPSYADRNFRVRASDGEFVLKIARAEEPDGALDLQNQAMAHLRAEGVPGPEVIPSIDDQDVVPVSSGAQFPPLRARLVTWVSGTPLAAVQERSHELLCHFGSFLARLDSVLVDFRHVAARRPLEWDLRRSLEARHHLPLLEGDPIRHRRVASILEAFARNVEPIFAALPQQLVHNDANDHNVLVSQGRVSGIIDFGDIVETARVCDPAIAATYLMLGSEDPFTPAEVFLRGYLTDFPLEDRELEALAHLIPTRLAVSVLTSTHAKQSRPDDPYLDVTEPHAWALLERLEGLSANELLQRIVSR